MTTQIADPVTTKDSLSQRIEAARARTDELFQVLKPEALYDRPVPERHRLIFYLGHLEAFDWNQICRGGLGIRSFHPEFDTLFEFGIDPAPGLAPADRASDWPSETSIREYNRKAREHVNAALAHAPTDIVQMAIEHRLMHAETFAYLIHNLPHDRKIALPASHAPEPQPVPHRMVEIAAGQATLGQDAGKFGWDNEFERHIVDVPAFAIGKFKVTNGDYLKFVNQGAPAPHFWQQHNGAWLYRGMFRSVPLPLDHPVYVTHSEASAYARWRGLALPTEAQYHRAAFATALGRERFYPWGDESPSPEHGNFDFHEWDPVSVQSRSAGDSAFGVSQMIGNGWEWTSTPFAPFAGFKIAPTYPGYSKNFFDGQHFVMKGGSPRTAATLLRRSFRNWFRPNYPHVYATFRLVEN